MSDTVKRPVLPVIFRVWRGEVAAYFPTEHWDTRGSVTCYVHVGQHGGADRSWLWKGKRATPAQYADLLAELQSIYETVPDAVTLRVYQRATGKASYWNRSPL